MSETQTFFYHLVVISTFYFLITFFANSSKNIFKELSNMVLLPSLLLINFMGYSLYNPVNQTKSMCKSTQNCDEKKEFAIV
jgi:hypothetical protein